MKNIKKSILIWSSVLLVTGLIMLLFSKLGYSGNQDSINLITHENPLDTINQNNIISSFLNRKYTPVFNNEEEEEIDYDAILGLTQGPRYSNQLVAPGSKNILFTGSDTVSGLNDTIGILSIDSQNKKIKVIMFPRDLYIDYNLKVRYYLDIHNRNRPDYYKINSAHHIGPFLQQEGKFNLFSINFLAEVINEVFDIKVDDYISINPGGFAEIVNIFGGVNMYVPYNMYYEDPFQDLYINLEKGQHRLNGKTAEGFVRFRQGYDEEGNLINYGDFERKKNQINFIKAFIDQHGTISNVNKIPELIGSLSRNIRHSMGIGDILTSYIGLARDVITNEYEFESITVSGKGKIINRTYYVIIED
ncbi:UNVERIFIED_CONTAM: LytR family transcriptional attenuator [Acetivibrio alkalicellulosi]